MTSVEKQILIVEDTLSIGLLIKCTLKNLGFGVDIATTANGALEMLKTSHHSGEFYDIILLDMHLPDMTTYDLFQKIRQNKHHAHIIAMSADNSETTRDIAFQNGAIDFFVKPLKFDRLQGLLGKYCSPYAYQADQPLKRSEQQLLEAQYLDYLKTLLPQLAQQVPKKDLKVLIHQLKGSAAMYGFSDLLETSKKCFTEVQSLNEMRARIQASIIRILKSKAFLAE